MHEDGTKYKCDVCEYSTTNKSHLATHIKSIHLKEKFDCKLCDYKATRKDHLRIHFTNVHRTNIIICQICNKRLKNGSLSLASHTKKFHSEQTPLYSCQMCPYQTIHRENLKTHTENVHQKQNQESTTFE